MNRISINSGPTSQSKLKLGQLYLYHALAYLKHDSKSEGKIFEIIWCESCTVSAPICPNQLEATHIHPNRPQSAGSRPALQQYFLSPAHLTIASLFTTVPCSAPVCLNLLPSDLHPPCLSVPVSPGPHRSTSVRLELLRSAPIRTKFESQGASHSAPFATTCLSLSSSSPFCSALSYSSQLNFAPSLP